MSALKKLMTLALLCGAAMLSGHAAAADWFTCPSTGIATDPAQAQICSENRQAGTRDVQIAQLGAGRVWLKCANEGSECRFRGKQRIAFGAKNNWVYGLHINSVMCNSGSFGRDPAYGIVKACYYEAETPDGPRGSIDPNWQRCSGENGFCNFSGQRRVAFGARGKWSFRIATNGVQCNTATFGDPINGVVKGCYLDPNY